MSEPEYYTARQLIVDPGLQRDLVKSNYQEIFNNYDPDSLGQFIVSRRANGTLVILDGQHRWHAVNQLDPDRKLQCQVHDGLTKKQEAEIFLRANAQAAVNTMAKYKMAVIAERPAALRLEAVLERFGLKVGNSAMQVSAVTDLLAVQTWPNGEDALEWALDVLTTAWHGEREDYTQLERRHGNRPYRGVLIQGMARVRQRYGHLVKKDKMVAALLTLGSRGPENVFTRASTLRASLGRTAMDATVARVLVEVYNSYKKQGPNIDPWDFSTPVESMPGPRPAATALLNADVDDLL